jgi:chaperonin GroEL
MISGASIVEKLKSMANINAGYDARNKRISHDLINECGVVDPTKVVKSALRYGAGLASILLTAECAVVDEKYDFVSRFHEHIKI